MTVVSHLLTGSAIALVVHQPILAISLAYISHFVLDALPHFEVKASKNQSVFERNKAKSFQVVAVGGAILTLIIFPLLLFWLNGSVSFWVLISCLIASILPDLVWVPRFIREVITHKEKSRGPISEFHVRIQKWDRPRGLAFELPWLVFILWAIVQLK